MSEKGNEQKGSVLSQTERLKRYAHLIEALTGRAVAPVRFDGYVNLMNRYGTEKDVTEHYQFQSEPAVPDEMLTEFYEGNGLFAKIIDTPAEEAIKHGFTLEGVKEQKLIDFYEEALDELDWEETAINSIKWARLFGGSIAVMLINDGRGIDEPLDWKNIQSIDDIRVYDRSVIQPDYSTMFTYSPDDPFRTRGSRLGTPEYYHVYSKYGAFTVHESRCLVFRNGVLPENCSNSIYELWGMPEYIRIRRAIRDSELAHSNGPKLLEKSVQAVYKMKDLAAELATEEGESRVLRRLQVIDMARGMLNSIAIDNENEDYDFKTFQFTGVAEIIDTTCNQLSALTSIPQTILFGRSPAGMNSTGESDMENWYSFIERIQKRMLKSNLRYLLSVVFQAGVATGEVDEVPKIKPVFNPLWSLSELEQAQLEQTRAATQQTKAATAQAYVDMQAIDPSEVRRKLADSEEFDVENMLDDLDDEDIESFIDSLENAPSEESDTETNGNSPIAAPEATKLPQDMSNEENAKVNTDSLDTLRADADWITINGTHVPLDDKGNVESGGPSGLQGMNFKQAKSSKSQLTNSVDIKSVSRINRSQEQNEWANADESDRIAYLKDAREDYPDYGFTRNGTLANAIASEEGLNAKPTALAEEDFDEYVQQTGCQKIYRGVQNLENDEGDILATGASIRKEFALSEDSTYGGGNFGSGYHFSNSREYAQGFAYESEGGELLECAIKPSAYMMNNSEWEGLPKTRKAQYDNDEGLYALTHGYDGIVSTTGVINIVNRGALVYKDPNQSKATAIENTDGLKAIPKNVDAATTASVGVLVISDGKILSGIRHNDFGYGQICGPGGHVEEGETPEQAAFRETEEEFGVTPKELIPIGYGPKEPDTGLSPKLYLCTEYVGEPECLDLEMGSPTFRSLKELTESDASLFQPFKDSLDVLNDCLTLNRDDGGPGSGFHNHNGVPGQLGGSAPSIGGDDEAMLTPKQLVEHRMAKAGYSKETLGSIRTLFNAHTAGGEHQKKADEEIAKHISDGDNIGKALQYKASLEEEQLKLDQEHEYDAAMKKYEMDLEFAKEQLKPGGIYASCSDLDENELLQYGILPTKPEKEEPRFYRKGDMDKDVLSFTTNERGAGMSPITNGEEGYIGWDETYTLKEMQKMGFRPIAGIQSGDVGASGESEVLFAKFPHNTDSRDNKASLARFKFSNNSENPLTNSQKTGIVKLKNLLNYTSEDGGPGSGNFGHSGVPGQTGGSAPSGASGVTAFKRSNDKIAVTSDVGIKRGKHGKVTMLVGEITGVEDFAGVDGKKPVLVEAHLIEQFGGKPGTWRHTKGIGKIRTGDGAEKLAELHWFENDEVGQIKWKVKKYMEDEHK